MKRLLAIGVSLVFVVGTAACGGGDDTAQQQSAATGQEAGASQPSIDVSDSELRSFIEASLELESFREEMRTRMQEASGQEQGQKVRKQLLQERDSIIEASGLSGRARYDTIMEAVKSNEQIRKRYTSFRDSMEADSTASDTTS